MESDDGMIHRIVQAIASFLNRALEPHRPRLRKLGAHGVVWFRKAESSLDMVTDQSDETAFLPAALEIVETPPSPLGRTLAGSIGLFFVIGCLWAFFGSVDIIATAEGKIVPTGRTKIIQPLDSGVVRAIHVQDGQFVRAGDTLIEIDSTVSGAERDRLNSEYLQAACDAARLRAAVEWNAADHGANFVPPEGATEAQINLQHQLLDNEIGEIKAKLSSLDHQIAQNQGNRDAIAATIQKLKDSMPYLEKRSAAREYLADKGYGSKLEYLTAKQDLVEHQREVTVQEGKLAEAAGAVSSYKEQRKQAEDEYRRTNLKNLSEAESKAASLQQQLLQATQKYDLQTLIAPVDGTVQQLSVHTEGGVVTPAEVLMSIVPADSHLEIEAMVLNKDIGFVHAGQQAEIKIDTFDYTKYGLSHGVVESVSQDAIVRDVPNDKAQQKKQSNDGNDTSEPAGQDLVYSARIRLDQTHMDIDGRSVGFAPGMAVTAEIKTGSRRIVDYLLSPLSRHEHQAFKER